MEKLLLVVHYVHLKNTVKQRNLHKVELKLSTSLLRYTKEVRADKAFYEAGMVAKKVQIYNHAFIFLNRYLDLSEAIEDTEGGGTAGLSDNTDFEGKF